MLYVVMYVRMCIDDFIYILCLCSMTAFTNFHYATLCYMLTNASPWTLVLVRFNVITMERKDDKKYTRIRSKF